jgi:hypothetical protein
MAPQHGFFRSLFDFSFTDFITTRVIKVLYALAVVFCALAALGMIIGGFSRSPGAGILWLIVSPIVFLFYVLMVRVWLEVIIIVFRIAEHVRTIAERGGRES